MSDFGNGEIRTFPGRLRGYRYFRMCAPAMCLHSVVWNSLDTWWDKDEKQAECQNPWYREERCADSPGLDCRCGFYGWYEPGIALNNQHNHEVGLELQPENVLVFGVVSASGNIVPGTVGFRAERMKIEALCVGWTTWMRYRSARGYSTQSCYLSSHYALTLTVKARHPGIQVYDRIPPMIKALPPSDVSGLMSDKGE